jgi:hypothetical protein
VITAHDLMQISTKPSPLVTSRSQLQSLARRSKSALLQTLANGEADEAAAWRAECRRTPCWV